MMTTGSARRESLKVTNQQFWSGFKQGQRDRRAGTILRACPYQQSLPHLRKYKAWVSGWHKSYFATNSRQKEFT